MLRKGLTIDRGWTIRERSDEREVFLVRVRLTEKLDAISTHGIPTATFGNGIADGHHVADGSRWTRHETGAPTRATALTAPGTRSSNNTCASIVGPAAGWVGTARARLASRARVTAPRARTTKRALATGCDLATCGHLLRATSRHLASGRQSAASSTRRATGRERFSP